MRLTHVLILLGVVGLIGVFGLVVVGAFVIPQMDFGWFKTPQIDKKNIEDLADKGVQTATGYNDAKTPSEAMDLFRKAIQERKYKFAAKYCTKSYADMLLRAHDKASELAVTIDQISDFGKEKGLMTDKLTYALWRLDPFPKNFKVGPAPEQKGDKNAFARYLWEPFTLKSVVTDADPAYKVLDPRMFQNVLAPIPVFGNPIAVGKPIELVKEGEDWKLNIQTTPDWEFAVSYFIDHARTYHTGLDSFRIYMVNGRYDSSIVFENEVMDKLRAASAKK